MTEHLSIGPIECDIRDEQQQLVARAVSTCMTVRGDQARGRSAGGVHFGASWIS